MSPYILVFVSILIIETLIILQYYEVKAKPIVSKRPQTKFSNTPFDTILCQVIHNGAMRFERYFIVETFVVGNIISLENEQAKHCALVMRHSTGDKVTIFNGKGGEFTCEIIDIHKRNVELKILEFHNIERELNFDILLFASILDFA